MSALPPLRATSPRSPVPSVGRRADGARHRRRPDEDCDEALAAAGREVHRLEERLAERERDFQELRHRVANSLQLAASFLALQGRRSPDEASAEILRRAGERIAAIGAVHKRLDGYGAEGSVDLAGVLKDLVPDFAASAGLACQIQAHSVDVGGETAMRLAMLVNELAINAGKHGYRSDESGTLKVRCGRQGDVLELMVQDDGSGLPDGFAMDGGRGLGLNIVTTIARQLGANIEAENDGGARFRLRMPLTTRDQPVRLA